MKRVRNIILSAVLSLVLCGCTGDGKRAGEYLAAIANPSFETGDLYGWTQSGDIYRPECVTELNVIDGVPAHQVGRYHLSGKYAPLGATGTLKSGEFVIGNSGYISFLIAGGKNSEKCYAAIVDAANGQELARMPNTAFSENILKEQAMTDRYARVVQDLSGFIGRRVYFAVIDNDAGNDYSYLSIDAVDVNVTAENLTVYRIDAKNRKPAQSVEIPDSKYQVKGGAFDSLEYWAADGSAFAPETISADNEWTIGGMRVPYGNDGNFYNGFGDDGKTGTLTSQPFELGGTGIVTFKLGGGRNGALNYVSVYEKADEDREVARLYNQKFLDFAGWKQEQVGNPLHINNMVQYKYDLSAYLGKNLYFKIVDRGTTNWGMMFCDSFITYYNSNENVPDCIAAENILPVLTGDEYQISNGGFETGDLTGWTADGNAFLHAVSTEWRFWAEQIPLDKAGKYLVSNIPNEADTGTLRSGAFTVSGSGVMSFRLGGGSNPEYTYISVCRAGSGEEVARFGNSVTIDHFPSPELGLRIFNMQRYTYDLSVFMGERLYLEIVDNASLISDPFNGMVFDDFITYYASAPNIEGSVPALNILKKE